MLKTSKFVLMWLNEEMNCAKEVICSLAGRQTPSLVLTYFPFYLALHRKLVLQPLKFPLLQKLYVFSFITKFNYAEELSYTEKEYEIMTVDIFSDIIIISPEI